MAQRTLSLPLTLTLWARLSQRVLREWNWLENLKAGRDSMSTYDLWWMQRCGIYNIIYIYIRCSLLSHRFSHPVLGHTEVNACEVSQQWLHTLQLLQTIDQTELARAAKMWVVVPKFDHLKRLMLVKEFHKPSPSHHHVYIGGINMYKAVPVMGGLLLFYPHYRGLLTRD